MLRSGMLLVALLGLCHCAWGSQVITALFDNTPTLPSGMTTGGWGYVEKSAKSFGTVEAIPGLWKYHGIRVISKGRYQGLRIDLAKPITVASLKGGHDSGVCLELYLRNANPGEAITKLGSFRMTLITDKGSALLAMPAANFYPMEAVGSWTRIGLPLAKMTPLLPDDSQIRRILITTDAPSDFYLGRLAFVLDTAPIRINPSVLPSPVLVNKRTSFNAGVDSGLTPHETTWIFDSFENASIDATGDAVSYTYDYIGTYTVTCTVRDLMGWKEPITQKITVKVRRN